MDERTNETLKGRSLSMLVAMACTHAIEWRESVFV